MNGHYYYWTVAFIGLVLILSAQTIEDAGRILRFGQLGTEVVVYEIQAFQRSFRFPFSRNAQIIFRQPATSFQGSKSGFTVNFRNVDVLDRQDYDPNRCEHFTHFDESGHHRTVAAVSECHNGKFIRGFLSTSDTGESFDIASFHNNSDDFAKAGDSGIPVLLTSVSRSQPLLQPLKQPLKSGLIGEDFHSDQIFVPSLTNASSQPRNPPNDGNMTLELAVFVDSSVYSILSQVLDHAQITDSILALINQVQALYRLPSLLANQRSLQIRLNHLEIQLRPPLELVNFNGQQLKILESFCKYQAALNNPDADSNPGSHWDLAVYLTGLDLWSDVGSFNTLGLANTDGICKPDFSCLVAELGTHKMHSDNNPYPSAGFGSGFILAHEIGHALGMRHDDFSGCDQDGYIMSPSRGTSGETSWSNCSRQTLEDQLRSNSLKCLFEDSKEEAISMDFDGQPGLLISPDEQCQLFLKAFTALAMDNGGTRCQVLLCKERPTDASLFLAGPALQGSECGPGKRCYEGECLSYSAATQSNVTEASKPEWGPWEWGPCKSGCISKSKGFRRLTRSCISQQQFPVEKSQCIGEAEKWELCDDSELCRIRRTREAVATRRCLMYKAQVLKKQVNPSESAEPTGSVRGLPGLYSGEFVDQSCQIFCQFDGHHPVLRWSRPFYYLESNLVAIEAEFPQGTWCHRDTRQIDYYCQNGECRP